MAIAELIMPKMGESIMEATILRWHKKVGDHVKQDETVLDIATDKVDSEVPSTTTGIITELFFKENDVVPIGAVIAKIETVAATQAAASVQPPAPSPVIQQPPQPVQVTVPPPTPVPPQNIYKEEEVPYTPQPFQSNKAAVSGNNRFFSPLVLNIANSEGLSLSELERIPGTGADGRVSKRDVLQYIADKKTGKAPTFVPQQPVYTPPPVQQVAPPPVAEPVQQIIEEIIEQPAPVAAAPIIEEEPEEIEEIAPPVIEPVSIPEPEVVQQKVEAIQPQIISKPVIVEPVAVPEPVIEQPKVQPVAPQPEPVATPVQQPVYTPPVQPVYQQQPMPVEFQQPQPVYIAPSPVTQHIPKETLSTPPPVQAEPIIQESPKPSIEVIEMDRMRKLIAKHMVDSTQTSAHVTSFAEADVTNMVAWREKTKPDFEKREGMKLTFTPMFIECLIRVMKRYPIINSSVEGDKILIKNFYNIGMATALPNGNLIVPVIKHAEQQSLVGLTRSVNVLADKARNNKLNPDDIQGGTFTISNVGTFGSLMGTPIINQPQVAILAVGVIKKKPVVVETEKGDFIGIRHIMFLSLSYDHRIIDGSVGASFLTEVAKEFENWDVNRELKLVVREHYEG